MESRVLAGAPRCTSISLKEINKNVSQCAIIRAETECEHRIVRGGLWVRR